MNVLDRLADLCPDGRGLLSEESVESYCALCKQHESSPAAAAPCVTVIERTSEDAFLRRVASQCGPVFVFWLAQAVSDGEGALAARLVRVAERLDLSLPDDVAGRLKDSSIVDTATAEAAARLCATASAEPAKPKPRLSLRERRMQLLRSKQQAVASATNNPAEAREQPSRKRAHPSKEDASEDKAAEPAGAEEAAAKRPRKPKKKVKWADYNGKDLELVRVFSSQEDRKRRGSFSEASSKERVNEADGLRKKEEIPAAIATTTVWRTPTLLTLPTDVANSEHGAASEEGPVERARVESVPSAPRCPPASMPPPAAPVAPATVAADDAESIVLDVVDPVEARLRTLRTLLEDSDYHMLGAERIVDAEPWQADDMLKVVVSNMKEVLTALNEELPPSEEVAALRQNANHLIKKATLVGQRMRSAKARLEKQQLQLQQPLPPVPAAPPQGQPPGVPPVYTPMGGAAPPVSAPPPAPTGHYSSPVLSDMASFLRDHFDHGVPDVRDGRDPSRLCSRSRPRDVRNYVLCEFFLKNRCRKGTTCPYLHPVHPQLTEAERRSVRAAEQRWRNSPRFRPPPPRNQDRKVDRPRNGGGSPRGRSGSADSPPDKRSRSRSQWPSDSYSSLPRQGAGPPPRHGPYQAPPQQRQASGRYSSYSSQSQAAWQAPAPGRYSSFASRAPAPPRPPFAPPPVSGVARSTGQR